MMAEEDRISSLPDHLLLEIISRITTMDKENQEERFMSTKEVIQTTTTISKRWQHLWTRLPSLVFLDDCVRGDRHDGLTNYFSFISETLTQCPTDVNLNKFILQIIDDDQPILQVNSWIHYATTRNVQEIDLRIINKIKYMPCEDELFFNNSCLISLKVSSCLFNPPTGAIHWNKLKFLCIDEGKLDADLIGKILSGSPCLETLELKDCYLFGGIQKSLFGNIGVLERLSCDLETYKRFRNDDELFFDDPYSVGIKLSRCVFNPHNGGIRWDKLEFLCIKRGELDEDLIGNILSGSPCLKTLELSDCHLSGRIQKSLFGNFGVLERLSCDLETYERFSNDDELSFDGIYFVCMKLFRCVFNPSNGAIRCDKLKFLRIDGGKLDDDSIGKILSGSPFLETLQLNDCYGCRRIDVTSTSVKSLVLSGYGCEDPKADYYKVTVIINAPYISTLTIEDCMYLEELLLENVASLVKADLSYMVTYNFAKALGLDSIDVEEKLLRGLLSSLSHVNEIAFRTISRCARALTRLEAKGFEFRKGSCRRVIGSNNYQVYSLVEK